MKIRSLTQSGIAHLVPLLLIVLVAVLGFAGWRVYDSSHKDTTNSSVGQNKSDNPVSTTGLATYHDDLGKFSLKYPANWKSLVDDSGLDDPANATSHVTITSPKGTILSIGTNWGGKGGDCDPAIGDKPHAQGNTCPTLEYLSSEPIKEQTYMQSPNTGKKEPIYIVTTKFTDHKNQNFKQSFAVGLDVSDQYPFKLNDPKMGFVMEIPDFGLYSSDKGEFRSFIYAYASSDDASFLKSTEAQEIKDILATFTYDK